MRRSRRRRKLTWFPPLGTPFTIGEATTRFGGVTFEVPVSGAGVLIFTEVPLTFDFGQEAVLADSFNQDRIPTLADLTLSSWRLRRAVGKIFATYVIPNSGNNDPAVTAPPGCAFSAGLMVRRTNELAVAVTNVDPFNADDYDDPWIWRRSWLLGQDARYLRDNTFRGDIGGQMQVPVSFPAQISGPAGTDEASAFARFPNTTAHYGSVQDGGHVDAKTNRIIGPEDRLFLSLATKAMPIQPQDPNFTDAKVIGMFDFRYLGHPMSSSNRRNASR